MTDTSHPVVVVGAGLAGLACARQLHRAGVPVVVVEAADGVGGRVRTDEVKGFRLDRGFQVFFTAYPEARRVLDYGALDLRAFEPGAMIRADGGFHRVLDPFRAPVGALRAVNAPVGSLTDKLRILRLRQKAMAASVEEIFREPERPMVDELRALGFSTRMIDRLFRPLFGGIFLDASLSTTSRMFYFVYKMMSEGDTSVPARGMGAIPEQLASGLPPGVVRLNTRVEGIRRHEQRVAAVLTDHGEVHASAVVVATDVEQASTLTGSGLRRSPRPVSCVYFAAPASPIGENIVVLDGEGAGPVLNLSVMSDVAPEYAPAGRHLVSAVVLGSPDSSDLDLERAARTQLSGWFGQEAVARWEHLRTYRIPWAQFDQSPGAAAPAQRDVRRSPGLYVCGDHVENASINGALQAGRRAADAVLEDLGA